MKAAQIENGTIIIKERENEALRVEKVLLLKFWAAVCAARILLNLNSIFQKDGTVLGHEIVAKIVDIDSETNFKQGDVIITSHHIPCGKCEYCKNGNVSMCRHFKETNIRPGGFSELVFVSEEHLKNAALFET